MWPGLPCTSTLQCTPVIQCTVYIPGDQCHWHCSAETVIPVCCSCRVVTCSAVQFETGLAVHCTSSSCWRASQAKVLTCPWPSILHHLTPNLRHKISSTQLSPPPCIYTFLKSWLVSDRREGKMFNLENEIRESLRRFVQKSQFQLVPQTPPSISSKVSKNINLLLPAGHFSRFRCAKWDPAFGGYRHLSHWLSTSWKWSPTFVRQQRPFLLTLRGISCRDGSWVEKSTFPTFQLCPVTMTLHCAYIARLDGK